MIIAPHYQINVTADDLVIIVNTQNFDRIVIDRVAFEEMTKFVQDQYSSTSYDKKDTKHKPTNLESMHTLGSNT